MPSDGIDTGADDAVGGGTLESLDWLGLHPASKQANNAMPTRAARGLIRTRSKVVCSAPVAIPDSSEIANVAS